jgi:DNA primase
LDFPVYVVTIPEGDDPDTYIVKHGQAAFEQFVKDNMTDGYTYLLNLAKQDLDLTQISGQRSYLQQALTIIKPIQDDMIKQVYLNQISHDIGLPVEEIIRTPIKQPAPASKADDFRATLLSLLLQELDVTKQMRQHPFYDELPGAWKQLIEFIISENGYNIELAIERFPLDVCAVFDQRRREAVSPKDRQNWPVLLRQLLVEQIEQDIRRINQDQNLSQEEKLKQVINKQKKIALLWNKETQ